MRWERFVAWAWRNEVELFVLAAVVVVALTAWGL